MDAVDWRTTLQPDSRQRIVNKIMETLKRCLPISSGPEGLVQLSEIATRFEEKIYTAATSQSDYLRKISMKMLTMETKASQPNMANNNIQPNSAGSAQNPPDPVYYVHENEQFMDCNNWRPIQAEPNMDTTDWRTQLQPDSRQRVVNKIMETLNRHLPMSGPEGLVELSRIAARFEDKIFDAATSQSDYLRKISMKMLIIETKSQTTSMANTIPSTSAGSVQNPPDSEMDDDDETMDTADWRTQVQPNGRQRIINKIMETLKRHLSISGPEDLVELNEIAARFENKVFDTATSRSDYLRKISIKLLTMETNSQNPPKPGIVYPMLQMHHQVQHTKMQNSVSASKQSTAVTSTHHGAMPLLSNRHMEELLSAQTILSISSNTNMFKIQHLEHQKQELEQQFREWQMYQQGLNQQMQHVLQQQEQQQQLAQQQQQQSVQLQATNRMS